MTRIQSGVGLITGIPIEETVNKLMEVAARPRDILESRKSLVESEKLAVQKLSSLVLAFQFEADRLASGSLFDAKAVTSSNEDVLTATLQENGNPAVGSYQFRALQTASAQQLVSSSFSSLDDLDTTGTLTFGFGGFVDKGIALSELNNGAGVARGKIRITDRAGNSADVDLGIARTIDDVLEAINTNSTISVTASVSGDAIKLTDTSGGAGNLRVQNVGDGTTATGLGLDGINVAASTATGSDVFALHASTTLSSLNDGAGVELKLGNDLQISFRDQTTLAVDLGSATTLGEVLTTLNAASPTKLTAAIAAGGNGLVLTDLTAGAGAFAVTNVGTGTAATGLGLTTTAAGGTLTGRRLVSGLGDTLVSSLRGGQGLGTLGVVDITNRSGVTSNVDLSAATTLADIVAAINAQATNVTASVNSARNGILLTDTTGATASNFIIANGDANNSATALGIVANAAVTTVNSGSLARHLVGRATLLSSLDNGEGVNLGDLLIKDSNGVSGAVDLNTSGSEAETLGDVIDRINALTNIQVEARINATGDGILLVDQASGPSTLEVKEVGNGTMAADLRLLGAAAGGAGQQIDGTSRFSIDLSDLDDPGATIQLASLNAGGGVSQGSFKITDTSGQAAIITVTTTGGAQSTVADVINAINAKNIGVEARINDAGSGILLFDTVSGSGTLKVEDLGGGDTAADLGLDATVENLVIDGFSRQAIDGAGTFSQSLTQSVLSALASKITNTDAGVTASTFFDGSGYRLQIAVDKPGAGNEILVDALTTGLEFSEFSRARDAALEFGGTELGSGLLITSDSNSFNSIVPGVDLAIVAPSQETVTVDVAVTDTNLVDTAQEFVDAFNSIRANLDEVTEFNAEELTTGILFGTTAALRVESDLNNILSGRFLGVGRFTSLESIGISFDDKGRLTLNTAELTAAFADHPDDLQDFFTHETLGLSARLDDLVERLAGDADSVLSARTDALDARIKSSSDRIAFMDERLARERDRLFTEFALLESIVAELQQSLTALSALQIIPPLTSRRTISR